MDRSRTVATIKKRLQALGCPFCNEENIMNKQIIVNIVGWIEDQCIRLYDIDDRKPLRTNDNNWNNVFNNYLSELACPCLGNGYCEDNKLQCLLWIVSHAISVEYEDNFDKYNSASTTSDLSDEDVNTLQSFGKELLKIANFMNLSIVDENDISSTIDIIDEELKNIKSQVNNGRLAPLPFTLDDLPITLSTNNPKLHRAICVLECLYNEDVREIQDKINYIIEQVQVATANPLTDPSLGVVGF